MCPEVAAAAAAAAVSSGSGSTCWRGNVSKTSRESKGPG